MTMPHRLLLLLLALVTAAAFAGCRTTEVEDTYDLASPPVDEDPREVEVID